LQFADSSKMEAARRPMAQAMGALMGTLRGKFSNRQGHSKGAFPLTSKRGPRDFYKGKGAKSTGRLTKQGAFVCVPDWCATTGAADSQGGHVNVWAYGEWNSRVHRGVNGSRNGRPAAGKWCREEQPN